MLKTILLYTAVVMVLVLATVISRRREPARIKQRSGPRRRITPEDCQ